MSKHRTQSKLETETETETNTTETEKTRFDLVLKCLFRSFLIMSIDNDTSIVFNCLV